MTRNSLFGLFAWIAVVWVETRRQGPVQRTEHAIRRADHRDRCPSVGTWYEQEEDLMPDVEGDWMPDVDCCDDEDDF
jgi:hypothetical protein